MAISSKIWTIGCKPLDGDPRHNSPQRLNQWRRKMRAPPENENPAPFRGGSGAHENDRSDRTIFHLDNPAGLSAQAFIGKRTDDLAIIADWKDELIARIDRAQMYLELVGLSMI